MCAIYFSFLLCQFNKNNVQLHSIRFDESVNSEDSFWIINENLLIAPLLPVLKEIRSFVMLAKETVIIDFGDFPIGDFSFN